jgi:cytoskeletal protein CcmA (bactofilin family)
MSGPDGQLSKLIADESSLNRSADSGECSGLLPNTSPYFDAWLESIHPILASEENPIPAAETFSTPKHAFGPPPVPGEFRFEGTLRVDCYVTGLVRSQTGTMTVTETGEVDTDLFVAVAIIDGLVRGDIKATERVELNSSARVIGNIDTPALAMQPGAVFEGYCHFVQPADKVENQGDLQSPAETPRLSAERSRGITTGSHEAEAEAEAKPLAAAAGR